MRSYFNSFDVQDECTRENADEAPDFSRLLPEELLLAVFRLLDAESLIAAGQVSRETQGV